MNARRFALAVTVVLAAWLTAPGAAKGDEVKLPAEVLKILENAEQIEVVSVDPGNGKQDTKELGGTSVKDAAKRKQIREALYRSVAEGKEPAKCFEPRHIIRATSGGKTVNMVICFECSRIHLFVGDQKERTVVPISSHAEAILTQILKDAGVPLAPK